jgi:hypothetical protein
METHRNLPEKDRHELASIFTQCTDAINTFVGAKAFKPSASFNAALFDALMVGTALRLEAGPITDGPSMQASLVSLLEDKEFFQWISQSTSDDEVVKGRIARATDAIAKVL